MTKSFPVPVWNGAMVTIMAFWRDKALLTRQAPLPHPDPVATPINSALWMDVTTADSSARTAPSSYRQQSKTDWWALSRGSEHKGKEEEVLQGKLREIKPSQCLYTSHLNSKSLNQSKVYAWNLPLSLASLTVNLAIDSIKLLLEICRK